jgi:hypothetical protein
MRGLIAYLVPGWSQKFVEEMREVEGGSTPISIGKVRQLGCIFAPLRAYCNGIFTCLRSLKQGRKLSFAHQRLFRHDIGVIRHTLEGAPSVRLLSEPTKLASIADGALHACGYGRAARSGPRFPPPWFLLLAGYENLTAPLFALSR